MSHRDDCPDRSEAEREGRRSFDRGLWRNPYDDRSDHPCAEAEQAWRDGYRRAERLAAEEREEEWEEEHREQQRQEMMDLEASYYEQQYEQTPDSDPT